MAERNIESLIRESSPPAAAAPAAQAVGRIKDNVRRMLDGGADDQEIDEYLADEGVTADQLRAVPDNSVGLDAGLQLTAGLNRGIDDTLNFIASPFRAGINAVSRSLGYGDVSEPLQAASRFNQVTADDAQTTAGRYAGTIGEVVGGGVLPTGAMIKAGQVLAKPAGMLAAAAQSPGRTLAYDAISSAGAGGGIQAARDEDLGAAGELAAGLAGGFAAPAGYAAVARAGDIVKDAAAYGNRTVQAARNPEGAALERTADSLVETGTPAAAVRAQMLTDAEGKPILSQQLAARGNTEAQLADMIARRMRGETSAALGAEFGVAPSTIDDYVNKFQGSRVTPMTIPDLVTEMVGPGGAMPILRQGRGAFGAADNSAVASKAFSDRQTGQSGRVADVVTQSGNRAGSLEGEVDRLRGVAKTEERDAYATAYQHQAPVIIDAPLNAWRARAQGRHGIIGNKLNEAIDLFYTPVMKEPLQPPASWLRIKEAEERLADARAEGADPKTIRKLYRRARIATLQDQHTRALRPVKVGETVQNVRTFTDARESLDHMIELSYESLKPTKLTAVLQEFRREVNAAARSNNPSLATADARFYGNRTAEAIIEDGGKMGKRLTPKAREAMRDFRDMTPNQQELFRVAFEQRMADDALNVVNNGGAANQFSTKAFEEIMGAFYPKPARGVTGPARKQQVIVYKRGRTMLRELRGEAIGTATGNFITGRANSPTAPWLTDIEAQMEGAKVAADIATGRLGRMQEWLATKLARQIGQKGAAEQLKILSEMDKPSLLLLLNRLEEAGKGKVSRDALVTQLRELRRPKLRAAPQVGAALEVGNQ